MKNWAKREADQHERETPSLVVAALKGIISVAGAMLLIALAIWLTTK